MTEHVLLTGATGFIGRYLVRRLVQDGVRLRVLARQPEQLPSGCLSSIEVMRGDVRDRRLLHEAVRGVDTVLHLAACARAWCQDRKEYRTVNAAAVKDLLDAVEGAGVKRLVHVSTILTLPPYRAAAVRGAANRPTPYETTKLDGERLVRAYAASGGHAVIVHPTRVYGPGPLTDANGVTRAISLYLDGKLRIRLADDDALANYVHAADVAEGIVLAARRGVSGNHYVLGGDNASFSELLALASELSGIEHMTFTLPARAALAAGRAAELWGHLGGTAPITTRWIRVLLEDRRADIQPTRDALAYRPRSLRTGLSETIRWLRAAGITRAA